MEDERTPIHYSLELSQPLPSFFDGRVFVWRNFAPSEVCLELTNWALGAVSSHQFAPANTRNAAGISIRSQQRWTSRANLSVLYPEIVYALQLKLRSAFHLASAPIIDHHGRDGVVVTLTMPGGDVYRHLDPPVSLGYSGLRCNLLASAPEVGGEIFVAGRPYRLNRGDLMAYLVTEYPHEVHTCFGKTPRVLFMFGFEVPRARWEAGDFIPKCVDLDGCLIEK